MERTEANDSASTATTAVTDRTGMEEIEALGAHQRGLKRFCDVPEDDNEELADLLLGKVAGQMADLRRKMEGMGMAAPLEGEEGL